MSTSDNFPKEEKIDDIIHAIRGIINNKDEEEPRRQKRDAPTPEQVIVDKDKRAEEGIRDDSARPSGDILELTDYLQEEQTGPKEPLISPKIQEKTHNILAEMLDKADNVSEADNAELNKLVKVLIKPMLKSWLDQHLPSLLEKILRQEIKEMLKNR